ncbi:hypothetical protein L7F22_058965 [Adiantum nelumboides]|nr:hypothetical protein [Adiantum nelumboides]
MLAVGQQLPFDPILAARSSGRQRWTPSQIQLQILESVFDKSNGTPSKQRIKELTVELGKHGSILETNVYNWFQNRKARAKRKQQHKDGDSELELEEVDLRKDKRAALDLYQDMNHGLNGRVGMSGPISFNGGFSEALSNTTDAMFAGLASSSTHSMQLRQHVDGAGMFRENMMQNNDHFREFSTIVVLIDGKPWEVPSTTLDLKGSFGETSALLDSQRQVVPIDERGFTTCPLHPGENYTLIK